MKRRSFFKTAALGGGALALSPMVSCRAWEEPALLKIAYAYEQASKARKKPEFMKPLL